MKGSGFELGECRFRLDIKKFFSVGIVKHWNRLPSEFVHALCQEAFKDEALNGL